MDLDLVHFIVFLHKRGTGELDKTSPSQGKVTPEYQHPSPDDSVTVLARVHHIYSPRFPEDGGFDR